MKKTVWYRARKTVATLIGLLTVVPSVTLFLALDPESSLTQIIKDFHEKRKKQKEES